MDTVLLFIILFVIFLVIAYVTSGPTSVSFRIVYNTWWMRWAVGMVLWPWMWFRRDEGEVSDRLFRHELQHCYQVARMGRVKFYVNYLYLLARHGYRNHPYELEAEAHENEPLTDEERQWLVNGKVIL